GLAVAGIATYGALRSFMLDRVDEQLTASFRRPLLSARASVLPSGGYLEVRDRVGIVVRQDDDALVSSAPPALPSNLPVGPFTVGATSGSASYRAQAERIGNGNTLVIALPLDETQRTLHRLLFIELVVASAVLGGLAALGWWLVGFGLRPLD